MDEIIKFNNFTNEYNYILEIVQRLKSKLMPQLFKSKRVDWNGLFVHYDANSNGYIEMAELKLMMKAAGMEMATDAEVAFAWNIINSFRPRMESAAFVKWGKSLEDKSPKRLMLYGQYLDAQNLKAQKSKNVLEADLARQKEIQFFNAMRGLGD